MKTPSRRFACASRISAVDFFDKEKAVHKTALARAVLAALLDQNRIEEAQEDLAPAVPPRKEKIRVKLDAEENRLGIAQSLSFEPPVLYLLKESAAR